MYILGQNPQNDPFWGDFGPKWLILGQNEPFWPGTGQGLKVQILGPGRPLGLKFWDPKWPKMTTFEKWTFWAILGPKT